MDKHYFLFKLIPQRPAFHLDMTDDEKAILELHKNYWAELTIKGISVLYGPVFDPDGVYGMAVMEVNSTQEAEDIASADPSITNNINTYELIPMMVGMIRK